MKNKLKLVVYFFFGVLMLGCSSSEKNNANYKEACEKGEFLQAYEIVKRIKVEVDSADARLGREPAYIKESVLFGISSDLKTNPKHGECRTIYENKKAEYEEARHYVILHEATYILETQGMEGLTKIAFIVKEHDASWVYKDLIDIAVAMGNEDLESRLKKLAGL